jgi:2'-5' RNA ligase
MSALNEFPAPANEEVATTCFLALLPDDAFAATVMEYKRLCESRIGPQLYLDDPPHLTLYLANFARLESLRLAAQVLAGGMRAPSVKVCGWHVFRDDPLNGNHTLVCDIAPETRHNLVACQQHVCDAVSSLRDVSSTRARYTASWQNLSESAQNNVTQWGFPFVSSIWHPHVTVASIRPNDWDAIWPELKNIPPSGVVRFPKLCLYALEQGRPVLLERFDLESMP